MIGTQLYGSKYSYLIIIFYKPLYYTSYLVAILMFFSGRYPCYIVQNYLLTNLFDPPPHKWDPKKYYHSGS